MSDCDSIKLHSVTPVKSEEVDPLIPDRGATLGGTIWLETVVGTVTVGSAIAGSALAGFGVESGAVGSGIAG